MKFRDIYRSPQGQLLQLHWYLIAHALFHCILHFIAHTLPSLFPHPVWDSTCL